MYFKYKYKYFKVFKYYPNTSLYYPRTSQLFAFTCSELIITNYQLYLISTYSSNACQLGNINRGKKRFLLC